MQYSPKLKKAMQEIKEILEKNDIAGFVVLHTPGFSEYMNHLSTSYSCAEIFPEGVRVRLKQAEVGKEKAKLLAEGTFNMIDHLTDVILRHADMYMNCHKNLESAWEGRSLDGGSHTSHDQQNN